MPETPPADTPPVDDNPPAETPPVDNPPADTPPDANADTAAEVEKWKALSREWEKRAKGNSKAASELEELRKSQMSEQEKAVEAARQTGETEATSKFAQRLAVAEIKAALTGIVDDPTVVIDELNLAKYVTDTGDVDAEAVTKLRDTFAALAKREPADFGAGNRGGDAGGKPQLTQDDVKRLTSERKFAEIEQARQDGRLNTVLGIT